LFLFFQIHSLQTSPWAFLHQWQQRVNTPITLTNCTKDFPSLITKLRQSVTFLPLKDQRYAQTAMQGHTWFMSSLYDTHIEGEVQYQKFPSESSQGRLLCIKGRENHDGAFNYYSLAWNESLPYNATYIKGLTFIYNNHYDYFNIWHGLSSMVPFVGWHKKAGCAVPNRWILYHCGELRNSVNPWLKTLMEVTFGNDFTIEIFKGFDKDGPFCFEKAVVMRHNEGGMSRQRRMDQAYDLMRCKARQHCKVSLEGRLKGVDERGTPVIGMTLLMRRGARSWKNDSTVIEIFQRACKKIENCRLIVSYPNNLSFCGQVRLKSLTDIVVSPHGAQLSNLIFMNRHGSIMEFFPKGMIHRGMWHDPSGESCPYSEDDRRCMSVFKNGRLGHDEKAFAEWTRTVLKQVQATKMDEALRSKNDTTPMPNGSNNPIKQKSNFLATKFAFSPKLSLLILAACATLFIIFQIQSLHTPPPPPSTSHPQQSWALMNQLQNLIHTTQAYNHCTQLLNSLATKLSQSVTFLPLKDLRYAQTALQGHTWFMSSMYDTQIQGEVQFQKFPSNSSLGRVLCIKGRDTHDGVLNSYALAWPEYLPYNATFFEGLTYVSYNHYNYDNIWHGLSAMVPFVAWHIKEGCKFLPNRWILYHWGEIRSKMGPWLGSLMEATFDGPINIENFDGLDNDGPYCFGEAVVMRHNEGGMSRERRLEVYDLMRCKARAYCNVSSRASDDGELPLIGMTMFMRTGARSFENESAVIEIFGRECSKVGGCKLSVSYSNNLTFCEQTEEENAGKFSEQKVLKKEIEILDNSSVYVYKKASGEALQNQNLQCGGLLTPFFSISFRICEADEQDRHPNIPTWSTVDKHVLHG
ncbi:Glycosyltransferase 61, partial [Dillenia turbinata]